MKREQVRWFVVMALLALVASATAPAFPMVPPVDLEVAATAAGDEPPAEVPPEPDAAAAAVEQILQQQEEMLRGAQFSYDPDDRRDPFRSLYDIVHKKEGPRPPGIAGMLVDEIDLTGIVQDASGESLAYFTGSDNKGYFLHVGERTFDGTLMAIDPIRGSVTFRQQVDDPRQIKPYRDVVRRLVPLDEESAHE